MKRKRLDRDGWGFQHFPYYQMRVELPYFQGTACLISLTSGQKCFWQMPRAGRVLVAGAGMTWLQLIPDGAHHVLTCKFTRRGRVAVWYADVIERVETDEDGVLAFVDQYLDVIFNPQGDMMVDDRDELDAAHESGELTDEQYQRAIAEGERIIRQYGSSVRCTERWCSVLLRHVRSRLKEDGVYRRNV